MFKLILLVMILDIPTHNVSGPYVTHLDSTMQFKTEAACKDMGIALMSKSNVISYRCEKA